MDNRLDLLRPAPPTPPEELCSCPTGTPIKLMGLSGLTSNPLHCLRCNREVAPERLHLSSKEVEALAHWNGMDGAIGWLELDSGPYADWARSQLLDPKSPVNIRGLELVKELNERHRCYFWFFQPEADDDFEPRTTCPVCERPLAAYDEGLFPQMLCDHDHVVVVGGRSE